MLENKSFSEGFRKTQLADVQKAAIQLIEKQRIIKKT